MSLDIRLSKKTLQSYFMICMYTVVVKMLLFYVFIFNVVCVQFATILRLYELGMVTCGVCVKHTIDRSKGKRLELYGENGDR